MLEIVQIICIILQNFKLYNCAQFKLGIVSWSYNSLQMTIFPSYLKPNKCLQEPKKTYFGINEQMCWFYFIDLPRQKEITCKVLILQVKVYFYIYVHTNVFAYINIRWSTRLRRLKSQETSRIIF